LKAGVAELAREEYWQEFLVIHHRKFGVLRFESLDRGFNLNELAAPLCDSTKQLTISEVRKLGRR
jgi:hypothetical protein